MQLVLNCVTRLDWLLTRSRTVWRCNTSLLPERCCSWFKPWLVASEAAKMGENRVLRYLGHTLNYKAIVWNWANNLYSHGGNKSFCVNKAYSSTGVHSWQFSRVCHSYNSQADNADRNQPHHGHPQRATNKSQIDRCGWGQKFTFHALSFWCYMLAIFLFFIISILTCSLTLYCMCVCHILSKDYYYYYYYYW